jgi:hypothetical protein
MGALYLGPVTSTRTTVPSYNEVFDNFIEGKKGPALRFKRRAGLAERCLGWDGNPHFWQRRPEVGHPHPALKL